MTRQRRRFSAQEKVAILRRHLLEKVPVSELCDEHHLAPNLFYRWQKEFFENGAAAFERDNGTEVRQLRERNEALKTKLAHKDEVIAEIMESHVALKKNAWPALKGRWTPHDTRDEVVDYVHYWSERTQLAMTRLVGWLGLPRSTFYDWRRRYGRANEHNALVPRDFWLEDWEKIAIMAYARAHPLEGYRRLAFMMLDDDVVAVSPSSVYRVLVEAQLMRRWERKLSKKGKGFTQPLRPHEHWHVDITYINICGTFYYLCSVLDGYSRTIVHWDIREAMTERDVEVIIQRAREKFPDAHPRIISDNGPQFIANDFKAFIRLCGMTHVRISPGYPQSNGKKERFYQTLKSECIRPGTPLSLEDARRLVAAFVEHYNTVRLHSALGYVAPADKLAGRAEAIWAERDRKLAKAREARRLRRAQARQRGDFTHDLTLREETPMLHPAGETDAGPAGEHPARDSRPGRRMTVEGEPPRSPNPHRHTAGSGHPEPPNASENSRLPQASESLISEGRLSSCVSSEGWRVQWGTVPPGQ